MRLNEVAHVYSGVENERNAGWFNGTRAIYLAVQRQPGTNTVEVVDRIKELLPSLAQQLPSSVDLKIRSDRSVPIRESVDDVKFTLVLTMALVVLVIFLFLRNASATIIPSLALPFSIVGTFTVMYVFDYSLDNLSLMALTLSVGFVVDDAIVMLENIVRHMEMGKPRMQAALDGSKEIAFTIVSMTISLAAVFIPILFMGGIVGRLMREFAVTIAAAILVSGVVSLTLTPMLSSRFLKAPHSIRHGFLYNLMERFFDAWLRGYSWSLRQTIRFKGVTMLVSAGLIAGDGLPVHADPDGVHPERGYRAAAGTDRDDPGSRLRRDGRAGQGRDAGAAERPERAGVHGQRGWRSRRWRRWRRPAEHRVEAARAARADGRPGHRGAAADAGADPGHPRVPVESAGDPHRRHDVPQPVPVHAPGPGHRRSSTAWRRRSRRRCGTSRASRT